MLACSLGDRSRGILNGNPNTELAASSRPGGEIGSAGTALAQAGQPSTAPKGRFQLGEQPDQWDTSLTMEAAPTSCSFPLSSLCPEGLCPTPPSLEPPDSPTQPVQATVCEVRALSLS